MDLQVEKKIIDYIRASYPLLYIVSHEEKRVEVILENLAKGTGRQTIKWTVTGGLQGIEGGKQPEDTIDPQIALDYVLNNCRQLKAVFIFKDLHPYLDNNVLVRKLKDCASELTKTYSSLVILSPVLTVPPELEKLISVVDYPLPDRDDLYALLDKMIKGYGDRVVIQTDSAFQEHLVDSLLGMTITEAENVLARSLVRDSRLCEKDLSEIVQEKQQIIRKSGVLEFYPFKGRLDNVGGLDMLKRWLNRKKATLGARAGKYGLEAPRGVLLTGVPGCGKSLTAKSVAAEWGLPLLRFDLGRVFGSYVGESEANIRRAISTAESIAPCVLWIDELEKGFAGVGAGEGRDSGVSSRVFGTFITWMQEKTRPVFVVATANDVSQLPPELLRKGRFDEVFFIDLPREKDRREIFSVLIKKFGRNPKDYDLNSLASSTSGFSGADIEEVVKIGMEEAFMDGEREFTDDDMMGQTRQLLPLSVTMKERIDSLREWAVTRARPASER